VHGSAGRAEDFALNRPKRENAQIQECSSAAAAAAAADQDVNCT